MFCQKANGASALQDQVSWYKGHRTVQELQACGAKVCQERIRQRLKESQFVGIMLDESLDICVQKKLVIVCKLVIDGKPLLQFGTNIEVQNGKADTIVTALRTFLDEMKIPVGKVVGLGTDGASVMLGCKNGVVTVFKRLNPSLISVWCCAHRLSLACHWAGQRVPALQKLQETLVRLYKYFKYSAVRTNELKQLKNLMQEKVRKLKKPTAVRWLSLQDAVVAAQESWGCLVLMLEHEVASNEGDTALSTSLLKDIKTYKFIALLCMLRDVLEPLTACSKSFQKDIIDVEETNTLLQATLDNVTSLAEYPGPHVAKLHASLEGEGKYQTIAFRATLHQKEETSNTCRNFVNALDAEVARRFPEGDMSVLKSLNKLFNPKYLPQNQGERQTYGIDLLDSLAESFPQIDRERAMDDYRLFKCYQHLNRSLNLEQMCTKVIQERGEQFPDFAVLAQISLVVPLTSVPCERAFSQQNNTLSAKRSRMSTQSLNNKMLLISEKRQFDCTHDAVMEFASKKRIKLK